MRLIFTFIILLIVHFSATANLGGFFMKADRFFKQYVADGQVDYNAVKKNPSLLTDLVDEIGNADLGNDSEAAKKAFYIDAYNILIIKAVAEKFPVSSPLEIEGIFKEQVHRVAGEGRTLNELENEIIRPRFKDARIHFALVCAAKGCPELLSRAYTPSNVEDLLNERAFRVVNNEKFVKLSEDLRSVTLSKLFEWYKDDYVINGEANIIGFINLFRKDKLDPQTEIEFSEYNWDLNSIE